MTDNWASTRYSQTSFFDTFKVNIWTLIIPKLDFSFGQFAAIYLDNAYYVIGGGSLSGYLRTIGRLDPVTSTWSEAGLLNRPRGNHAAIFDGQSLLVIGGSRTGGPSIKTESCKLQDAVFTCTEHDSALNDYRSYPEVTIVDESYSCQRNFV